MLSKRFTIEELERSTSIPATNELAADTWTSPQHALRLASSRVRVHHTLLGSTAHRTRLLVSERVPAGRSGSRDSISFRGRRSTSSSKEGMTFKLRWFERFWGVCFATRFYQPAGAPIMLHPFTLNRGGQGASGAPRHVRGQVLSPSLRRRVEWVVAASASWWPRVWSGARSESGEGALESSCRYPSSPWLLSFSGRPSVTTSTRRPARHWEPGHPAVNSTNF